MTQRSDIAALDGQQLGRAMLTRPESRTLTNAVAVIRSLGDVPLAHNLDALHARLRHDQVATDAKALRPDLEPHEAIASLNPHQCFEAMDEPDVSVELPEVVDPRDAYEAELQTLPMTVQVQILATLDR